MSGGGRGKGVEEAGDVQLGHGVRLLGQVEGQGEVVGAKDLVEDAVAVAAVVVDGLVEHVPVETLALVVVHDVVDVALHDLGQGLAVPRARGDPVGQLRVPHERVAAENLAVAASSTGSDVALRIGEAAAGALGGIPLLAVLGDELAELALVAEDVHVGRVALAGLLADARTKVLETSLDGELMELGRDGGRRKKRGEETGGVHGGRDGLRLRGKRG